jgi:hypothetical protein
MRKNRGVKVAGVFEKQGFVEQPKAAFQKSDIDTTDKEFEIRLINWGRVMNPRHSNSASTFWARQYYEIHNARQRRVAITLGLITPKSVMQQIEDEVMTEIAHEAAIEIERAWAKLGDFQQKQALLMMYVYRFSPDVIRSRLRLRGHQNLQLILWRAKTSLKQVLEKIESKPIIRPYNLNAA